jgi:hypothetical protein
MLFAGIAHAQESEIQRALVQRDQQSAEFAAGVRGVPPGAASGLHARQLSEIAATPLAPELRPYQRMRMGEERALVLTPPNVRKSGSDPESKPASSPLPLPGGPRGGVDPVLPQGLPY